jgi:hypothetical protein
MTAPTELVAVKLERLPLALYREASEHQDELQREFVLIQHSSSLDEAAVPRRLLRLVDELNLHFGAFSQEPRANLAAALERDDVTIDLEYKIPPAAKAACISLGALLDEADEFCRNGDHLLTLATEPGPLGLRRWFLGEFVAQIDGAEPTPWDEWDPDMGALKPR